MGRNRLHGSPKHRCVPNTLSCLNKVRNLNFEDEIFKRGEEIVNP